MLSLLRPARPCLRAQPRGTLNGLSKSITSSSARNALATATPKTQEDQLTLSETQGEVSSYREFMEKIGAQFEYATPNKWLGGSVVRFALFSCATGHAHVSAALPDEPVVQTSSTYL